MVDSLDSGSSVHSGRAGSTPASRTKVNARNRKISGIFLTFQRETIPLKSARKWSIQQKIQQDCSGGLSHERSSSAAAMAFTLFQSLGTETCFSVSPAYPDFEDEMCSFLLKKSTYNILHLVGQKMAKTQTWNKPLPVRSKPVILLPGCNKKGPIAIRRDEPRSSTGLLRGV